MQLYDIVAVRRDTFSSGSRKYKNLLGIYRQFNIECLVVLQLSSYNFPVSTMKSFAASTFGALTTLFFVLAGSVQAAVFPRDGLLPPTNVPLDLVPKYLKLMGKCNADDNTVHILLHVI